MNTDNKPALTGSQLTDEEIAKKVQAGDSELFGILVNRYENKIKRYAKKFLFNYEDAEDLAQQAFLKTYININSFDTQRKFSPWVCRIAHNEFINAIKKRKKEPFPFFDADTIFPHPKAKENPLKNSERAEISQIIEQCLGQLNAKYREPLILYYLEGFDYNEIADIMRIPISTVGVRLKRGKEKLKILCRKLN